MSSRRGYVTIAQVAALVSGLSCTDAQISEAEELVDAYVGYQEKFIGAFYQGEVAAGSTGTKIIDSAGGTQLYMIDDYFAGCQLEIVGGTGVGQIGIIASSTRSDYSVSLSAAFATVPDTTSVFRIYQLGKFPRCQDVITRRDGLKYYKSIPDAVRHATAFQVEFMLTQGATFFNSDQTDMSSENIGNYSYVKGDKAAGAPSSSVSMLAPKARGELKGIKNSTGRIDVGDR